MKQTQALSSEGATSQQQKEVCENQQVCELENYNVRVNT